MDTKRARLVIYLDTSVVVRPFDEGDGGIIEEGSAVAKILRMHEVSKHIAIITSKLQYRQLADLKMRANTAKDRQKFQYAMNSYALYGLNHVRLPKYYKRQTN